MLDLDLAAIVSRTLEYAPAVAILLYLNWRADKTINKILEWCLKEISDDAPGEH